jgi:hypothetical protein
MNYMVRAFPFSHTLFPLILELLSCLAEGWRFVGAHPELLVWILRRCTIPRSNGVDPFSLASVLFFCANGRFAVWCSSSFSADMCVSWYDVADQMTAFGQMAVAGGMDANKIITAGRECLTLLHGPSCSCGRFRSRLMCGLRVCSELAKEGKIGLDDFFTQSGAASLLNCSLA